MEVTRQRLKELLHYDPLTGLFVRSVKTTNSVNVGDVAGTLKPDSGYIIINIDYKLYRAHRLAFLYMAGLMPEQVDHEDHVRHNNKWDNLKPSTNFLNGRNTSLKKNNTSGFNGVRWDKERNKWACSIMINGKQKHLGRFADIDKAIVARKTANIKYGFHKNHGEKLCNQNYS